MHMRPNNIYVRLGATLLLFVSVLFAPWYVTASFAVLFVLFFNRFFEVVLAGLMFDALFGIAVEKFSGFPFVGMTFAIVILILSVFLKKRLAFYRR